MDKKSLILVPILVLVLGLSSPAEAKRKKRHRGPTPTHPVLLWARTLSESKDREERKIAAFKLSQYSQPIFQDEAINTLIRCMKDTDVEIKVLCTKAMGRAGTKGNSDTIRKALLDQYQNDPSVRNTVVRAFIIRQDSTPPLHDAFLESVKKTTNSDELLTLLSYFEAYGYGNDKFVDVLADLYKKTEDIRVKRSVVKVLGDRAHGQETVVAILAQCMDTKDTPLLLTCLAGLEQQGKKDARSWAAVEKTIDSEDPDVLLATLDVINVLPETPNVKVATRLVQITNNMEEELQEKAVLALGVCGDQSAPIVDVLKNLLEHKDTPEEIRVAAALVLGKQAASLPDKPKSVLSKCYAEEKGQSLRTACQLGLSELEARKSRTTQAASATNPVTTTTTTTIKTTTSTTTETTATTPVPGAVLSPSDRSVAATVAPEDKDKGKDKAKAASSETNKEKDKTP